MFVDPTNVLDLYLKFQYNIIYSILYMHCYSFKYKNLHYKYITLLISLVNKNSHVRNHNNNIKDLLRNCGVSF